MSERVIVPFREVLQRRQKKEEALASKPWLVKHKRFSGRVLIPESRLETKRTLRIVRQSGERIKEILGPSFANFSRSMLNRLQQVHPTNPPDRGGNGRAS